MGRKKVEESGPAGKAKLSSNSASKDGKKERISVSAMLASMDRNLINPKGDQQALHPVNQRPRLLQSFHLILKGLIFLHLMMKRMIMPLRKNN